MNCPFCNAPVNSSQTYCPNCNGKLDSVYVLTKEEREAFKGITIEQDSDHDDNREQKRYNQNSFQFSVKRVNLGSLGFLSKFLIALLVIFFLVVALPMTIFTIFVMGIVWWVYKMLFH